MRDFTKTRFDSDARAGDVGDLPNLADLMLVFATGLIAALAARSDGGAAPEPVETGEELPQLPTDASAGGSSLEAFGRVFRDPATGKLYVLRAGGGDAENP